MTEKGNVVYDRNARYRGRMTGIILDSKIIKETDELRGEIPRSRYINEALREHNKRMTIMKQRLEEIAEQELRREKETAPQLQNVRTPSIETRGELKRSAADGGVCFSPSLSTSSSSSIQEDDTATIPDGTGGCSTSCLG